MSRKANPTVVGAFVVAAAVLGVAGLFLFGGGGMFTDARRYVCYFDRSLKGLSIGSPVTFRGIQVGQVADIKIVADLETLELTVPVIIEIERDSFTDARTGQELEAQFGADAWAAARALVDKGLRAQLQTRSVVTGMLEVALDFHDVKPDEPPEPSGRREQYPEIPTIPSDMEQLQRTVAELALEEITDSILNAVQAVEQLATSPDLTEALTAASSAAEQIEKLVTQLNDNFDRMTSDVESTLEGVRTLVSGVEDQVAPLAEELKAATGAARATLEQADRTLAAAEDVAADDSDVRRQLTEALRELTAAAQSIRHLADQLERQPESLLRGKGGD